MEKMTINDSAGTLRPSLKEYKTVTGGGGEFLVQFDYEVKDKQYKRFTFRRESLNGILFQNCTFIKCEILSMVFSQCTFENCTFKNCYFRMVDVVGCDFNNCSFHTNTTLHEGRVRGCDFFKTKMSLMADESFFGLNVFRKCDCKYLDIKYYRCAGNIAQRNNGGIDLNHGLD